MIRRNKEKSERKRRKFRIWYWLLVFIVFMALTVFVAGVGFCYYIVKSAPEFDIQKMFEKESTRIFAADGRIMDTLNLGKYDRNNSEVRDVRMKNWLEKMNF